jgi:hypothetical protein
MLGRDVSVASLGHVLADPGGVRAQRSNHQIGLSDLYREFAILTSPPGSPMNPVVAEGLAETGALSGRGSHPARGQLTSRAVRSGVLRSIQMRQSFSARGALALD